MSSGALLHAFACGLNDALCGSSLFSARPVVIKGKYAFYHGFSVDTLRPGFLHVDLCELIAAN